MRKLHFGQLCLSAMSLLLVNAVTVNHLSPSLTIQLTVGSEVSAKSSGGRSSGGSFRSSPSRSSSSSSSSSSRSSSSYSRPSNNPSYNRPYTSPGYGSGTVVAPVPGSSPSTATDQTTSGATVFWIVVLIVVGAVGITFLAMFIMVMVDTRANQKNELDNPIFTVSKVQVALLAQAHEVQTELTKLTAEVDTSTPAGLYQLLQESVLVLLRNSENWSHVLANSETVKSIEEAEVAFNQLSIAERSKFSVETLSNVGGRVHSRNFKPDPEEDPASYIVVTLLVGTAHDNALFNEVRTEGTLKESLQKLAAISPDYLLVFELLWSPQAATDSLTYDELLTEYTDMVQI